MKNLFKIKKMMLVLNVKTVFEKYLIMNYYIKITKIEYKIDIK